MAEASPSGPRKRRAPDGPNWASEQEMEHRRAIKRRREEAEPYNDPAARRKAQELGMEEARRGGLSDASRVKAPPRGLLIEGSSSSEFVSAVEEPIATDDEIHANGAGEAVSPMPEGKEKRLPESESKGRAARRNQRRDALRKSYRDSGEEGPKTNGDAAVRGAVRAAEKAARKAAKKARREAAKEAATGFDPDARKRKRTVERNKRRNQNRKRWRESGGGGARRGEVA